jgi:hypothetical protein
MRPTGTTATGDAAQATRQGAVAAEGPDAMLPAFGDIERGFGPRVVKCEEHMTTTGS